MADAEVANRPYVATYGRRQQRREETPLSDAEGQSSQPSPRPRDGLFLDTSPAHNGSASRRSRNTTNDDETGNTSASSSDDARQATTKSREAAAPTRPGLSRIAPLSDDDSDDDDGNAGSQNALDRIRAQLRGSNSSNSSGSRRDGTSSLSSAPSLSQPSRAGKGIPGLSDSEDDEADRTLTSRPNCVGLLAGRMKARITTSSSSYDGPSQSFPSQRSNSPRRSFTLSDDNDSSSSLSDSAADSQEVQSRKDRLAATQRKKKLEEMAAKRRQAAAAVEPEVEVSLEDDFFNHADEDAPATDDPIRSSSTAGHDDSDDDLPDAREVARRAAAQRQHTQGKPSGSREKHKSSSKKAAAAAKPKGPKPLSKKEQEEMRKMQAKIERSRPMPSLALQSHPVDRQEYSIAQLAAKFKQPETAASPESDDPIEVGTPRRPPAATAKSKPSLPSPASLLPQQSGRSADSIVVSAPPQNAEDLKRKKAQDALRLRKQKWLQSQEENAQRPFMSSTTADSIDSQSDDLVFDLAGPSRAGKDDDDDLILVDTPKGAPGSKGKVASRLFAGKLQERSTNAGGAKAKASAPPRNGRQAPQGMSTSDFKQSMLDKIKRQNISIRAAREQQAGPRAQQRAASTASTTSELTDESSADALKRIGERLKGQPDADDEVADDADGGSEDEEFMPQGSGSEDEEEGDDDDQIEESGKKPHSVAGSEDEEEDALEDEEDVMPPSSQNTNRSIGRTGMENADSDEDDDEEEDAALRTARPSKKRAQRVVADDEDEEQQEPQAGAAAVPSSSRVAHSFGGAGGLTQFFQDTQQSAAEEDLPESQQLAAAEATRAVANRAPSAAGDPTSTFGPRPTNDSVLGQFFADTQLSQTPRGQSLDVIGATGRAKNADHFAFAQQSSSGSGGDPLSQFFNEGTQLTRDAAGEQPPQQPFAIGSMGPPTAIPTDGFAALRRQAQGDGQDLLGSPDSVLPTPEFSGEEAAGGPLFDSHLRTPHSVGAAAAPKQYLNHEGFFTQTRPVAPAPESAGGGTRSVQGGDSFGANASQWGAGESSSQQQRASEAEGESYQEPSSPSADTARRKRFRRAALPDEEDSEEEEAEHGEDEAGEDEDEDEEDDGDSRGSASEVDDHDHRGAASDDEGEDDVHPGATANAWEVLKRAAQRADHAKDIKSQKKRRHQYIEGEAEESSDEENGGGPTRKAGGLKGVFDKSDDENDDDDDSDSDDDGADLEGLVDDVKERDEAAKDKLALARYQQDLDVDEAAALALAEKAAKGELRGKRRAGRDGQGRLEELLDDDFDEERLRRMASRPKGFVSKRRKLEGGDGMDLLASKAESRAFVEGYAETHQSAVGVGEEYSFLAGAEDDDEGEEDSDEDEDDEDPDDEESKAAAAAATDRPDDDLDELDRVFAQRITRKELAKELQERRKKRRRLDQLASDDEEDEDQRRQQQQPQASLPPASRDFFATDESDNDDDDHHHHRGARSSFTASKKRGDALPSYLHDRINTSTTRPAAAKRSRPNAHEDDDDNDDEEDSHDASTMDPALALVEGLKRRRAVSPRTAERLAKVAAEYGDRSSSDAYTGGAGGGGGGGGSSITSFGARAARQQSGGVDRQRAGAGAFAKANGGGGGGASGGEGGIRRTMTISSSASSGLLAKRVVEESQ